MKITDHFRGIYQNIPQFNKKKSGGCEHVTGLDLSTVGFQPVMPKNLPEHCGLA